MAGGEAVPPLGPIPPEVGTIIPNLTIKEVDAVTEVAQRYLEDRFAFSRGVSYAELIDTMDKISKLSLEIQSLIDGPLMVEVWRRLEGASPEQAFSRDDVYPLITQVAARSVRAHGQISEEAIRLPMREFGSEFAQMVGRLKAIFDERGIAATASKRGTNTRNVSPFVRFVVAVMSMVPPELREHDSDDWGTADAVSKVLRALRHRPA
jgi:hypothetical protein